MERFWKDWIEGDEPGRLHIISTLSPFADITCPEIGTVTPFLLNSYFEDLLGFLSNNPELLFKKVRDK
jgi:hypothetical protein